MQNIPLKSKQEVPLPKKFGTLAIDLGNTSTVVAFQAEGDLIPTLIDLPPISRVKGEVPSLIWHGQDKESKILVGQQVLDLDLTSETSPNLISDFKRWIGAPPNKVPHSFKIQPERAGELLIKEIWKRIPSHLAVRRLVLTAPIETYRTYRAWLNTVCSALPIDEIALVDEPTAAAMGAGLPSGSKLLVVDIGGSTTDLSIVALEGGEGRPEPLAQLLRFNGQDLEGISRQILRCAKVLGKSGIRLGGRDLDRWIAHHLFPELPITETLLNAAEKLKCKLSKSDIKETDIFYEIAFDTSKNVSHLLALSKLQLEELLKKRGFLKTLESLLEEAFARARANGCVLADLQGVVAVGGGARIPLLRRWLEKATKPIPLITPPPIEAVATGALRLTPGVEVKDVLNKGVSLRCWDQRSSQHIWHHLFIAGQPWPTSKALEIVLAGSKLNQSELELVIAEPDNQGSHEVIYVEGIPTIKTNDLKTKLVQWSEVPISINLDPPGQPGEDCVRLRFSIDKSSQLQMEGLDLRSGKTIQKQCLGFVR